MPEIKNEQEQHSNTKSLLDINKEISNLYDRAHSKSAIPGSGRGVILG